MKTSRIVFGILRTFAPIAAIPLIILGAQCNNQRANKAEPAPAVKPLEEKQIKDKEK